MIIYRCEGSGGDMTQLIINIFVALALGLLPSLFARYVFVRKPLKSASSNWIAGISIIPIILAYRAFTETSEPQFTSLAGGIAVATFFLARAIMNREYSESLSSRIRLKLEDASIDDEERTRLTKALEKLTK